MLVARIVFGSFWISIVLLFLLGAIEGNYAPLFAVLFIYLFCYAMQVVLLFVGGKLTKGHISLVYLISCLMALFSMALFIAWLSGNSVNEVVRGLMFNRKDGLTLAEPYLIASILSYSYLFFQKRLRSEA
jgi:hypothetical protein